MLKSIGRSRSRAENGEKSVRTVFEFVDEHPAKSATLFPCPEVWYNVTPLALTYVVYEGFTPPSIVLRRLSRLIYTGQTNWLFSLFDALLNEHDKGYDG